MAHRKIRAYSTHLQSTAINQIERTNNLGGKPFEHLTGLEIQITFILIILKITHNKRNEN